MSGFSIFNARGSKIVQASAILVNHFRTAANYSAVAVTGEGKFLLEENISVLERKDLTDGSVVFCAIDELTVGGAPTADFFANSPLVIYRMKLPSGLAGESVSLEFLGTSHDGVETPEWADKSVMIETQEIFLSIAQGSKLDDVVMSLIPVVQDQKRQKGESMSSYSKSSGDDTKNIVDKDGVAHPSSNQKRDQDRIAVWTSLQRITSEDHRKMYMGNDGVQDYKFDEIQCRLEVQRSVITTIGDDHPLRSIAGIDSISHLEAVKEAKKTHRFLNFDFQRRTPMDLSLFDFFDGPRTEVYPPSATAMGDMQAMEKISRMFSGLERALRSFCSPLYKDVFLALRERLTVHNFPGRHHTCAYLMDVIQSPLFALSVRLREDKALDGSLRGPVNVRALLVKAYGDLKIPTFDGDSQSAEKDFLAVPFRRILWSLVTAAPPVAAIPTPSVANLVQAPPSTSQLKKMLRQKKASLGATSAAGSNAFSAAASRAPSVPAAATSQAHVTPLCLKHLAQQLGVPNQACRNTPCRFGHRPLNLISKAGAIASIENIKTFPADIDKMDLVAKISASRTMPL